MLWIAENKASIAFHIRNRIPKASDALTNALKILSIMLHLIVLKTSRQDCFDVGSVYKTQW